MDAAQTLLDIEHIKQLKHRYFRYVDTKDWAGVASCFVPEATAGYPQQECGSRDEIVAFLSSSMVPDMVSMHQGHHPEITIDGDTASGVWYLHDKVFLPAYDFALEGAAIYSDSYVRTEAGWLKTRTAYQRMFESTWKLSGIENFRLKQGDISRGSGSPAPM